MKKEIVILCIGSSQITGDSVGPMVGDLLKEKGVRAYVYGTMSRPVNAKNLEDYIGMIKEHHTGSLVMVVDATVGEEGDIGEIRINRNGVKPGGAVNKDLPRVGDIGILGVVAKRSNNLVNALMGVDALLVRKIARRISSLIVSTLGA
ncbi:MAG: spore protease YyaC [Clostridia bacterium]|jgi:putative sporulation protein YyaC|nr:spore protease YyaC [Clostridia bacterium]MCX4366834.1 spore protease YyaC [Clostridia bacterium]